MKSYVFLILSILVISILCYLFASQGVSTFNFIYLLPFVWIILYLIWVKIWKFRMLKFLIMLHFAVLFIELFSFILYRLFLKIEPEIPFNSKNYDKLNNLMFRSADALYIGIYLAVIVFLIDIILLIRISYKKNK